MQVAAVRLKRSLLAKRLEFVEGEREILHRDSLHKARSAEEVEKLDGELARDRDRLASDRDRKIAEIKQSAK